MNENKDDITGQFTNKVHHTARGNLEKDSPTATYSLTTKNVENRAFFAIMKFVTAKLVNLQAHPENQPFTSTKKMQLGN